MAKTAILLANLGSPDSYQVKDVRRYLDEFLMDERVIDIPSFVRTILVKGIIVPFRSPKSAEKYKSIWTDNGSPLIHISKTVQAALNNISGMPVELCMRYGNPTPEHAFKNLIEKNPDLESVTLIPLYPHYAMSSYETAVIHVVNTHQRMGCKFSLKVVPPYYRHPAYVSVLAESIKPHLNEPFDHLLFSYHGIPERHVKKTDVTKSHCLCANGCCENPSEAHAVCYRHQVTETTRLAAELLGLGADKYSFSFQSRLGADAWLKPYTAAQLEVFPKKGIKKLIVVCPAFVSDCLETLEEIQMEGEEDFMHYGGESYKVIPCLNERPDWIQTLMVLADTAVPHESLVLNR